MAGMERVGWWLLIAGVSAMTNWTLAMLYAPVIDAWAGQWAPFTARAFVLDTLFFLPFMALATLLTRQIAGIAGRPRVALVSILALALAGAVALHALEIAGTALARAADWLGYTAPDTPLTALLAGSYGAGPGPVLVVIAPVLAIVLRLQGIHAAPLRMGSVTALMLGAWVLLTPLAWGAAAIAVSLFGVDPFNPIVAVGSLPHHAVVAPGATLPMQLLRCLLTEAIWLLPFLMVVRPHGLQPGRRRDLMELATPTVPEVQWQRLPERG